MNSDAKENAEIEAMRRKTSCVNANLIALAIALVWGIVYTQWPLVALIFLMFFVMKIAIVLVRLGNSITDFANGMREFLTKKM